MILTRRFVGMLLVASAAAAPAAAQERPFVFSVSTPPSNDRRATVYVDASMGERGLDVTDSQRAEQRFGVQAALGANWTVLARVALSRDDRDQRTSQEGELLYNVVKSPARKGSIGVGVGLRHELAGTNVLLGRIVAGRSFDAWRVDGNALFEKPFAAGRDRVDLICSAGVARQLTRSWFAGIEMIGEDLEGFWETAEAEGGARLLIGPSVRLSPPSGHWQVSGAAGPIVHATRTGYATTASRSLPSSASRDDFGGKVSLTLRF